MSSVNVNLPNNKNNLEVIFYASVDTRGRTETGSATLEKFAIDQPGSDGSFAIAWGQYERDKIVAVYESHPSRLHEAIQSRREQLSALSDAKVIELNQAVERLWENEDFWIRR
jgi:hypothetical protein